jgi:hypothetical protein
LASVEGVCREPYKLHLGPGCWRGRGVHHLDRNRGSGVIDHLDLTRDVLRIREVRDLDRLNGGLSESAARGKSRAATAASMRI